MKPKLILQLVQSLEQTCEQHEIKDHPQLVNSKPLHRLPDFGWRFITFFVQQKIDLPLETTNKYLLRAYLYLSEPDAFDCVMPQFLALLESRSSPTRDLLNAYLLCRDVTLLSISERLKLNLEVVEIYHELCFNVRDRFDDEIYLAQIAYPNTRLADLDPDHLKRVAPSQILLQVAYRDGVRGVDRLLGLQGADQDGRSADDHANAFESAILNNGNWLAGLGLLNQKDAPGINLATKVLLARKKQREWVPQDPDQKMGLAAVGLGYGILDTVKKIGGFDFARRRQAQVETPANAALSDESK